MKALIDTLNQKKALVEGAFFVIVKSSRTFVSSSSNTPTWWRARPVSRSAGRRQSEVMVSCTLALARDTVTRSPAAGKRSYKY